MLNYSNLNDIEFEYLCQDIMQRLIGNKLRRFAPGKDGGIDLIDDVGTKNIIVQVKHYMKSTVSLLISSLKKEVEKVCENRPDQYYICCSKELSPQRVNEIYLLFKDYMESDKNIITLVEIDDFLAKPQNQDILKKHYKLWIDSTGILQDVVNNDIFVDCEALLSNIENEQNRFVQTSAYYESIKCLDHNRTLFITGDPGVGKTITSKMLTLYYAANGYKVRYTTNSSDLSVLKKSLSQNPEQKEIILVDDCFGQAYFEMKGSQNDELLSLIKYVNIYKNKKLILNSRVTIFQEAKERKPELVQSFENEEYRVFVIDMSALSNLEKARILYNHLYCSGIPSLYFAEIRKEKRYWDIIKHPNYNPRIIEFICNPNRYKNIESKKYYQYIKQQLDNPRDIWKDEYERRLQKSDRILLTTIYSFSDKSSNIELVEKGFEKRIMNEHDIDKTINQFEASLNRLTEGFVRIIDEKGIKRISMINPSINDYLNGRLANNITECQSIIENSYAIQQIQRMLTDVQLTDWAKIAICNFKLDDYIFESESQKKAFIIYYITECEICDKFYEEIVHSYLAKPTDLYFKGMLYVNTVEIMCNLLNKSICDFYDVKQYFINEVDVKSLLMELELDEMIDMVLCIEPLFKNDNRKKFIESVIHSLKEAVSLYCDYVDVDDFDVDVYDAINSTRYDDECGSHFDEYEATAIIEAEIKDIVMDEIIDKLDKLPDDLFVPTKFLSNVYVNVIGASSLVDTVKRDEPEYDGYSGNNDSSNSEIDLIFER